jgi:hypothetical protein
MSWPWQWHGRQGFQHCFQLIKSDLKLFYNVMKYSLTFKRNDQGPYSQHFIFFVTYEFAQWAWVLHCTRLERLAMDKQSSLLVPLVSYKEYKVLWIRHQWLYSQHFIFSVTYEFAQWAWVLHWTRLERLAMDKQSSLLGPLVSYKEYKVLWIRRQRLYTQHFIFPVNYEFANKLECYIALGLKGLPWTNNLAYWAHW